MDPVSSINSGTPLFCLFRNSSFHLISQLDCIMTSMYPMKQSPTYTFPEVEVGRGGSGLAGYISYTYCWTMSGWGLSRAGQGCQGPDPASPASQLCPHIQPVSPASQQASQPAQSAQPVERAGTRKTIFNPRPSANWLLEDFMCNQRPVADTKYSNIFQWNAGNPFQKPCFFLKIPGRC